MVVLSKDFFAILDYKVKTAYDLVPDQKRVLYCVQGRKLKTNIIQSHIIYSDVPALGGPAQH